MIVPINTPESKGDDIQRSVSVQQARQMNRNDKYKFENIRVYWYDNRGGEDGVHKSSIFTKIVPCEEYYDSLGYVAKIMVCEKGIIKKYGLSKLRKKCRDVAKLDGYIKPGDRDLSQKDDS